MDGITDAAFRSLVLDLGDAGGAVTEFLRLTTGAPGAKVLRRELGPPHPSIPVGLQVMAPGPEWVAETAARAEEAGASFLDLNFGCPVKRVFNRCAGSALLAHPERLRAIVAAAVSGTGIPVTAKVRAGIEDDARLEEVLDAAAAGGAAAILLHARLRIDSYAAPARWERIARASSFLRARHPGVVLVGNGGVERAADARRMREETGCDAVLVGRAAFADPFLFREIRGGPAASLAEAAAFALRYLDAFLLPGTVRAGTGKAKQFLRCYRAGGIFEGREGERARLLSEAGPGEIREWFAARSRDPESGSSPVPVAGKAAGA